MQNNFVEHKADFSCGKWIWSNDKSSEYVLFTKVLPLNSAKQRSVNIKITASYYYELLINGEFINRGPVYGDPKWCQYDVIDYCAGQNETELEIAVVVYRCEAKVLSILPAPGGLLAEIEINGEKIGTGSSWDCLDLKMWQKGMPKRGWALVPCEWYDANLEPLGWQSKNFVPNKSQGWQKASEVNNADKIWSGYTKRITPLLERSLRQPASFKCFKAQKNEHKSKKSLSEIHDIEPLEELSDFNRFSLSKLNESLDAANCFSFDFGAELVGHIHFEIEAEKDTVIEISTTERLQGTRPLIYNRDEYYTSRYVAKDANQKFKTFHWSGFRYLHIVIRGNYRAVKFKQVACACKQAAIKAVEITQPKDDKLCKIIDMCLHTLKICAQEHLIDCPSREQLQYWGDAVFIAQSLWHAFGESSYLRWYLECFINCPFNEHGLISIVYPGIHDQWILVDYTIIPAIGQQFYKNNTGSYYKPKAFLGKALELNKWFIKHQNKDGLIEFDNEKYIKEKRIRTFIDHPGIGWHSFPHPGIDRDGINCGLNIFYYNFIKTISDMATESDTSLSRQYSIAAEAIKNSIISNFYDGVIFHDAIKDGCLSQGTSWQTNALAVCFGLIDVEKSKRAIECMLEGYDNLCRCTPYFYFYLLAAMERVQMRSQAEELIKKQWSQMLDAGATSTWETFCGNEIDSLCHPWSASPVLFFMDKSEIINC